MRHIAAVTYCLFLLTATYSGGASAKDVHETSDSVRTFVQDFYAWYVRKADAGGPEANSDVALKLKPSSFSPLLVEALKEDFAAQAQSPDDVVGLDFDPFLNAQDICEHYKLGKITRVGKEYRVEIYGTCW